MPKRPCLSCGRLSPNTRCPACTRAKSRARGTTATRRYGAKHQWLRRRWQRELENAWALGQPGLRCWRCREPILRGQPWDLGHFDNCDGYAGPEHAKCNRATSTRRNP